jgi:hypothetical protein
VKLPSVNWRVARQTTLIFLTLSGAIGIIAWVPNLGFWDGSLALLLGGTTWWLTYKMQLAWEARQDLLYGRNGHDQ